MSDPVRLINRSGLASALLRAGSEERPSSARLRRALSTLGTAAAVGSLTGEAAGGGAGAIASGALGSALTKAGAGSVSMVLAAKWLGIGGLGALVAVGAAEIGSRSRDPLRVTRVEHPTSEPALPVPSSTKLEVGKIPAAIDALPVPLALGVEGRSRGSGEPAVLAPTPSGNRPLQASPLSLPLPTLGAANPVAEPTPAQRAADVAPSDGPLLGQPGPSVANSGQAQLRLAREVSLVDRAWSAMKRNDFSRAIAELANYEEEFPELGLHPEVIFVRMEAEDRLGRVAAAKLHASRILASYPKSAQAGRARALLSRP